MCGLQSKGQTTGSYSPIVSETLTTQTFDGDNQLIKNVTRLDRISDPASTGTPITTYFLNSSVLGKKPAVQAQQLAAVATPGGEERNVT